MVFLHYFGFYWFFYGFFVFFLIFFSKNDPESNVRLIKYYANLRLLIQSYKLMKIY